MVTVRQLWFVDDPAVVVAARQDESHIAVGKQRRALGHPRYPKLLSLNALFRSNLFVRTKAGVAHTPCVANVRGGRIDTG